MNKREIKALAEIMKETGLTIMELEEQGVRIHLERNTKNQVSKAPEINTYEEVLMPNDQNIVIPNPELESKAVNLNNTKDIVSPMVGVFYAAPKPGADPYVTIGSKVKKGDVLCIIEAMKLMNEITAESDGEIVDICVSDGQIVEFGQVLFKLF